MKTVAVWMLTMALALGACGDDEAARAGAGGAAGGAELPDGAVGSEFLRVSLGEAMTPADLLAHLGDLFNPDPPAAAFPHEVAGGLVVSRAIDPSDAEGVVRLRYQIPGRSGGLRDVASVPVSVPMARRFRQFVDAAWARMSAYLEQDDADRGRELELSLTAGSAADGTLTLTVKGRGDSFELVHTVHGPHVWVGDDLHGQPTLDEAPWTSLGVSVGFEVRQEELNFFVDKAYGRGDAEGQSFDHFVLGPPHDWLNVTVTPWLGMIAAVKVAFEAVMPDGERLPFSAAPASDDMGGQFIEVVNGAMDAMTEAERVAPGSSSPFEIPYFYDDPAGGVVQVRVLGRDDVFTIYYDLQTPKVDNRDEAPAAPAAPEDLDGGSEYSEDGVGRLAVTFVAADTVVDSDRLDSTLRGTILASVFRAEDVLVTGPIEGAQAVADIFVEDADLSDGKRSIPVITGEIPATPVKILGFIDIDSNRVDGENDPDSGDPVTVPFMDFPVLEGLTSEVTVSFDLVYF